MQASPQDVSIAPFRWSRFAALCSAFLLAVAVPAMADPPGRVGRLAEVQGQVWLFSPESGEWINAQRNRPVTTADRIATEHGARAEIQVGSSTLRLDGSTELEVLQLDDDTMRYQLLSGSVAARLRTREAAREFELHTAEGRFRPESAGRFRFDRIDETSHVTAWRGRVLFEGTGAAVTVETGQRAEVWNDAHTQYTLTSPVRDEFSEWVASRDDADERTASTRYVSPEMTGVEDLDRDGRWEHSPEYGPLWIPYAVAPGWAPYRYGHWAYVRPWGWTWVDDARWGFAPFHYGRWVHHRGAWCWAPGSYVTRPVYAPALVAWFGGPRAAFSISIGSGPSVGWFPLGPRETYVPSYHVSPGYMRNINVAHNHPETGVPRTPQVNRGPHGVTVVPSTVVMNRQPVSPAVIRAVDPNFVRHLAGAPLQAQPPVAAPAQPPRIDVHRGVPRERVRPPMAAAVPRVHEPDDDVWGRSRMRGPNMPLGAPAAPAAAAPAVTAPPAPAAAMPPARAAAPPPAAAVTAPPGRVWRGDEHVGHAPPRVRRSVEPQPALNAPAGRAPAITQPPVQHRAAPPAAPVRPPAAAVVPPSPPVQPAAPPQAQPGHPGRIPAPFVTRPIPQPPPQPAAPAAQGRERRSDQPPMKTEREERGGDRGRRG